MRSLTAEATSLCRAGEKHPRAANRARIAETPMHTAVKWQGALLGGVSGFFRRRVDRLLSLVDHLGGYLFYLADSLISLSFCAQLIVIRQRARRFLDPTFHFVALARHDFVLRFAENRAAHRLPDNPGKPNMLLVDAYRSKCRSVTFATVPSARFGCGLVKMGRKRRLQSEAQVTL